MIPGSAFLAYILIHNIYPPYFAFFPCVRCIFNVYWKALDNIMESCQSGRSCSTRNAVSLTGPRVRIPDSPPKTLKEFTWGFFFSFICLSYSSDMKPASKFPYETAAKGDNKHQQHHYRQYFHENKRRSALSDRWTYPYRCPYHGKSNKQQHRKHIFLLSVKIGNEKRPGNNKSAAADHRRRENRPAGI